MISSYLIRQLISIGVCGLWFKHISLPLTMTSLGKYYKAETCDILTALN